MSGKALRVVTLEDGQALHHARPDSGDTRRIAMKLNYYEETDWLAIDLSAGASSDAKEIAYGLVIDFDADRPDIGTNIQHALKRADLNEWRVLTCQLPVDLHEKVDSPAVGRQGSKFC